MSGPVLVLRPQPEADETAAMLRARGHAVVVSPLLAVEPGDPPPAVDGFDSAVVTSPRALPALTAALQALPERPPLFAVGGRCAALARGAGWEVRAVAPDAAALVAPVAERARNVLHAAPAERAFDLASALRARGVACATWTAYRTRPLRLSGEAREALRGDATVLLSSPRIAGIFAAEWRSLDRPFGAPAPRLLAISWAAAAPLAGTGHPVDVAERATLAALLDLL